MDRNREARRAAAASGMVATSNGGGLSRRRHRSSTSLRDSPDEDGGVELQESIRLRDRVKKERDLRERDRDRERDRERERERERERASRSSKRRRAERLLMHHNNNNNNNNHRGEDVGAVDDSSEESVNDDEDEEYEENHHNHHHHNSHLSNSNSGFGGGGVRLLPPAGAASGGISNHYHNNYNHQQLQHRKSFPPGSNNSGNIKSFRAAPVWKSGDEMIGVSVPRKARSAATKRSHDWMSSNSGGGIGGGEPHHRQASTSPVRQSVVTASTPSPAPPMSPSSSNVSVRKKLKPSHGPKPRPPKSSSVAKSTSSNPEELEIEIAEVLYGLMTQSQVPSKKETASNDSKEPNRSNNESKSLVSSPISGSNMAQPSLILPQNYTSSAGHFAAVAPKRKRPRQVSDNLGSSSARSSPISTTKVEMDQTPKMEISTSNSSPSLTPGSAAVENGAVSHDLGSLVNSQPPSEQPLELMKVEPERKPVTGESVEGNDLAAAKEDVSSSKRKESPVVRPGESKREDADVTCAATTGPVVGSVAKGSAVGDVDKRREEKFQIDLMAPPPQLRLSPEREEEIDLGAAVEDQKPSLSSIDSVIKSASSLDKEAEKMVNVGAAEEKKAKTVLEQVESQKAVENKERIIDLQLDLERPERESSGAGPKLQQPPPVKTTAKEEPFAEKTGHSGSSPLPMPMPSWPGGPPPIGYMAPLQGVVSMDGSTGPSPPVQVPMFSQPRPKRCATHYYIARNIYYMQQFMKMNPFWSAAAASSASLFGSKACNLNVVPSADFHANISVRGVNSVQDGGQGLAFFPGHGGNDKNSQPINTSDPGQRKQQIILQQALPPVAPNNILQGPAFIFPMNQQQAAVAAAARPTSAKSPAVASGAAASNASNSAAVSGSATGALPAAMSFNYPNMPGNETQYLAILQNNAYPFPFPAVGANPNYRGPHPQPLPLFNGSFYSSQMIHPSQLQQQPPPPSQSLQVQQGHQNGSLSSGSSSTHKHLQNQQQRLHSGAANGASGSGNLQSIAAKNRSSQQHHPPTSQHIPSAQVRQPENETGGGDSPSTADSRGARAQLNIYGQNFAMPMHSPNFTLISPPATFTGASAASGSGNQADKKQHQPQQPGLKTGIESLPPQTFAMSFGPLNGATNPGIDLSTMAQNHAIFQNFPEATRHNIQMIAAATAAHAAQQKKNFRISEDGKTGGGDTSSCPDDERKGLPGKALTMGGPSIAFSRSELADGSTIQATNVVESSARSLNPASGSARSSRSSMANSVGASGAQLQAQLQHQQQQLLQLHKHQQQQQQQHQQHQQQQQQQLATHAPARNKNPATSNGGVYSEHLASSASIAAKFQNALSAFPQNLVQNSNGSSPAQSPQWKNSSRTSTAQNPSSLASSNSSLKSLPQQAARAPQGQTQISFGSNQKSTAGSHGQLPASNQSPSPPMVVGSPTTSSMSKGASGSPRTTTSASMSNKTPQTPSLSTQQGKNLPSAPNQKSSPSAVGGRNAPSILGNPHVASNPSSGTKTQVQHHHHQHQQLPKNMQQAQLFFSNPYVQTQSPHSTSTTSTVSGNSGYYLQRRRPDQQQPAQQPPGSTSTNSTGMLSLSPVTLAGASTTDPAKAIAAAAAASSNMKSSGLPSQSIVSAAQFSAQSSGNHHPLMPAGFSYVHPVPSAVQVKPAEQKQPAD